MTEGTRFLSAFSLSNPGLLSAAETTITRAQSLRFKLLDPSSSAAADPEASKEIDRFVFQLLETPDVIVPGAGRGHVGMALRKIIMASSDNEFDVDIDGGESGRGGGGGGGGGVSGRSDKDNRTSVQRTQSAQPTTMGMKESLFFPPASAKEYIFRVQVPRPSLFSRSLPQRMFVVTHPTEFRIAAAFAQDTVFF